MQQYDRTPPLKDKYAWKVVSACVLWCHEYNYFKLSILIPIPNYLSHCSVLPASASSTAAVDSAVDNSVLCLCLWQVWCFSMGALRCVCVWDYVCVCVGVLVCKGWMYVSVIRHMLRFAVRPWSTANLESVSSNQAKKYSQGQNPLSQKLSSPFFFLLLQSFGSGK